MQMRRFANQAKPVFLDRISLNSLANGTLYYSNPQQTSKSRPAVSVLGSHAERAFRWLCRTDMDQLAAAEPNKSVWAAPLKDQKGFAVFSKQAQIDGGKDRVEIFATGGESVMASLKKLGKDFREANQSEFIRKLEANDSLDIGAFSELAGLLRGRDEVERRNQLRQLSLGLDPLYQVWLDELSECRNLISASKSASCKEVKSQITDVVKDRLGLLRTAWAQHIQDERRAQILPKSCQITLFGAANSGKSSLLNLISQKHVSAVSPQAGSTMSIVDQDVRINGIPIVLTDTVGLKSQTSNDSETMNRLESCDLKICMIDINDIYNDKSHGAIDPEVLKSIDSDTIVLINKRDTVRIRIPAPPAKIRFKNTPLSPQGDVPRHAMRGRVPLRLDGDTTGNNVEHGDFGLRVLTDVRLKESCLQECRAVLHRHVKKVRGGRFWLKVKPDHPMTAKAIGTRMGKGKAAFSHWEAKVPCKTIVFEIGGGVPVETARYIFKSVAARLPGQTEFVVAPKEENVSELERRIREYSKVQPMGIWSISCKTGEGVDEFLQGLSGVLAKKYSSPEAMAVQRLETFSRCASELDTMLSKPEMQDMQAHLLTDLQSLINGAAVEDTKKYLFHSKYGVLDMNAQQPST